MLAIAVGAPAGKKEETWLQVQSPDFLVITNASEKQGRRVAYQFEMIRAVFRQFFNLQSAAPSQPVIIIAARDEDTLKSLLPEFWEKKGSLHPAGIYLRSEEENYVGVRLDATMNQNADEPYEPVYHEYVHYLTRGVLSRLPLWMVEGLAEFYGNTRLEGKQVLVGTPSRTNLLVLHEEHTIPVSALFAINASSPYYHEENKASIFYAESWALTHYLVTRDWREHTHRVSDFLKLLDQGVLAQEAAPRTLGDPQELDRKLDEYISRLSFAAARLAAPPGVDSDSFRVTTLSEAESLARRAFFMSLDHHPQEAQAMLEESLKLNPNLAVAHEGMGFLMSLEGKTEEATKSYAQAVALNSQSCMANYYYAVSLFKGGLDDRAAAQAESSLRAAIKVAPDFAPAYSALAWLLASRHRNFDEAYQFALTAVSLEPGDFHLRLNSAQVLEFMGRSDDAIRVGKVASEMAKTPEELAQAETLILSAQHYKEFQERAKARQEAMAARKTDDAALPQEATASTQDSDQPPVLRRRDEATVVTSDHPSRAEVLPTRQVSEGTIRLAKCSTPSTIEITLDLSGGALMLYSDDFMKIPFMAIDFTPKGVLNPCKDIQGLRARIAYHPAKSQPSQGEVVEIWLMKE